MWKIFDRFGKREPSPPSPPADDGPRRSARRGARGAGPGESERELPTLICRQCGLQYANTGTYLQGAKCPACHPGG